MIEIIAEILTQPGSLTTFAVFYLLLEAAGIGAALHAAFHARSAQGATAWAVSLIGMPMVALPAYLVLGRKKFAGYIDARRDSDSAHSWIAEQARTVCDTFRSNLPDVGGRLAFLERIAHLPFTYGNRVELLIDGDTAFTAMFKGMEEAKRYILIQFFIVRHDALGQKLKELLIRKAKQGVKVYFLYDPIGSHGLARAYVRECRAAGVRMEPFRKGIVNPLRLNFRNHRKVTVVDGDLAFVGGLNVGVEYLGEKPTVGAWRDTQVEVEGPSADALQLIFAEDWHWATGETIDGLEWETREAQGGDADVLILPSGPADDYETCNLMFVHAIHSAEKRFWIASPYFVPNAEVISALQVAGLRGVDVRILLPKNPDHLLVYLASFYFMRATGSNGVRFFRYADGFMHQKAFLIDDFGVGIGTANLDNRSFRLNFEITLLSVNHRFAAATEAMFQADFARSVEVDANEVDARNAFFKLGAAGARLLAPIL